MIAAFTQKTLVRDVIFSIILLVAVVSALATFITIWHLTRKSQRNFMEKADQYMTYFKESLELPLWNIDTKGVLKFSQAFAKNDFLSTIMVADSDGRVIVNIIKKSEYELTELSNAITYKGEMVGRVRLGFSPQIYKERNRQLWALSFIIVVVTVFVLVFFVQLILQAFLIKPIHRLIACIDQISEGNYQWRSEGRERREIQIIILKFNQMARRVAFRERTLTEMNIQLKREIEERQDAEKALHQYERIVDTSSDLMAIADRHCIYQAVNKAFATAHKKKRTEIVGLSMRALLGPAWHDENMEHHVKRCLSGEKIHYATWRERPGSKRRYMQETWYPCIDGNDHISGVVMISRDMTATKELEEKFFRAQKLEAIGTLSAGIAHDFNNLMMSIQGNFSLIMAGMEQTPENLRKCQRIDEAIQRGANLTRQLLGLARGGKFETRPTDLNELARRSAAMFGRARKDIAIHERYDETLWTADVDRGQMEQVLLNLFLNAWQAMASGGKLHIETKNAILDDAYVRPYALRAGRYVKLSVTDTGVGMDKTIQNRIFDPFFTTKDIGRGAGLGLASAYGIIKNHNGVIHVYSEPGKGSTFNIYLPASLNAVEEKAALVPEVMRGCGKILLIDDEEMVAEVGAEMLEALGYEVVPAHSGADGLDKFRQAHGEFDLVVLDMIMPDMGGGETYDRLKAVNPDVRVLLSSGYSINGAAEAILKRGCGGFIQKPFALHELSHKIMELMELKN